MKPLQPALSGAHGESGQTLVLFAAMLVVLLGMVGLAIDAARMVSLRTDLQKTADAAVMAGVQELPAEDRAKAMAGDYVSLNGDAQTTYDTAVSSTYSASDTLTVTARREMSYTFMRVLGMTSTTVSATATARANGYSGGVGLVPWGIIANDNEPTNTLKSNNCYGGKDPSTGQLKFTTNKSCVLKFGAGSSEKGDFGAVQLDGSGAKNYRSSIKNGSQAEFSIGDKLKPETGNMNGPTAQGVEDRMARTAPASCEGNALSQVLRTNVDGTSTINPGCEASARLIFVPVVDQIAHPKESTIVGFAVFFLTGVSGKNGHTYVEGQFVDLVTAVPGGKYEGTASGSTAVFLID